MQSDMSCCYSVRRKHFLLLLLADSPLSSSFLSCLCHHPLTPPTKNNTKITQNHPTVVPLFETLDDLTNAPKTMDTLLSSEWYRTHIQAHHGGVQEVMIGEC